MKKNEADETYEADEQNVSPLNEDVRLTKNVRLTKSEMLTSKTKLENDIQILKLSQANLDLNMVPEDFLHGRQHDCLWIGKIDTTPNRELHTSLFKPASLQHRCLFEVA